MVDPASNLRVGTSGWSYKEWIGPFYVRKHARSMLQAYTKVFKTVEVDSTFYAYPAKGIVMGWARYSPENFIFSAKVPRRITHEKMLNLEAGVEEDLLQFCNLMQPLRLNGKLGCLLIQLPPKYAWNPDHLARFLQILPREFQFAVEFRHISWIREETWPLLAKYKIAYTIVDEPLLPPTLQITADFAYLRWHGHGTKPWFNYRYQRTELEPWVPRVQQIAQRVKNVYGYFNNHFHGYAVENCLQILEMLGDLTPQQTLAKNRATRYFQTRIHTKTPTLESFAALQAPQTFQNLLNQFIDRPRLTRAKSIGNSEIKVMEATANQIKAVIKKYHIEIDVENRVILHDCADWSRVAPSKKFCKHIGKLLLTLDQNRAEDILEKVYREKEAWEFKPNILQT